LHLQENIALEVLAEIAQLSVHHFARAFCQSLGISPHNYIVQRRVEHAQQLLRNTDLPCAALFLSLRTSDNRWPRDSTLCVHAAGLFLVGCRPRFETHDSSQTATSFAADQKMRSIPKLRTIRRPTASWRALKSVGTFWWLFWWSCPWPKNAVESKLR